MSDKRTASIIFGLITCLLLGLHTFADDTAGEINEYGSINLQTTKGVTVELSSGLPSNGLDSDAAENIEAEPGSLVTFSLQTEPDYLLRGIEILGGEGEPIMFEVVGSFRYSFIMPEGDVEIFVRADNYAPATRARCAYEIWKLAGSEVVDYLMTFGDVDPEAPEAEAIRWAASEGIMNGVDEASFNPDEPLLREELAVVMKRCADRLGIGTEPEEDFELESVDRELISDWAYESVRWAIANGIMSEANSAVGFFCPQGCLTCHELEQVLTAFDEMKAESESETAEPDETVEIIEAVELN